MTSDRGLCGAFNSNTVRRLQRFLIEQSDKYDKVRVSTIGRKGYESIKRTVDVRENYEGLFDQANFHQLEDIAKQLSEDYINGEVDEVYLLYNEFKSAITQILTFKPLFPIEQLDMDDNEEDLVDYEYEPTRYELLDDLLPSHVATQMLRALFESIASEHGARMNAMESATSNAGEMVDKLTLQYNRARQAAITTELMEIISGAEALK
jgi:F-type H+-transporting ATPase subunit gamma